MINCIFLPGKFERMRSVFWPTNSSIPFLLLRTVAAPSPITFRRLYNPRRRRLLRRNPPIDGRAPLQATASGSPMDSIEKNDGSNEFQRSKEAGESPALRNPECSSPSSDPPPLPPEKPDPGDCCGNGCFPCVWDSYYEQLEAYTKNLEAYNDRVSSKQK